SARRPRVIHRGRLAQRESIGLTRSGWGRTPGNRLTATLSEASFRRGLRAALKRGGLPAETPRRNGWLHSGCTAADRQRRSEIHATTRPASGVDGADHDLLPVWRETFAREVQVTRSRRSAGWGASTASTDPLA